MSNTSWKIGRLFGIRLEIHYSFLFLLGFCTFVGHKAAGGQGATAMAITLVLVFVSVCLHELGHCLTAQHYGIKVPRIVLMAIGGMAQMARIPREPRKEIIIVINGPLVNFAIALILFAVLAIANQSVSQTADGVARMMQSFVSPSYVRTPYHPWALNWQNFAWGLLAWNIAMGLFNLLPIFPMDGGRLLRAALATRVPYLRATQIAAGIAKILATIGIAWALLNHRYLLAALLTFIWVGGEEELKTVRVFEQFLGKKMKQIMFRPPANLDGLKLEKPAFRADDLIDDHIAQLFALIGATYPVYQGDTLVGVIYTDRIWFDALANKAIPPHDTKQPREETMPPRYNVLGVEVSAIDLLTASRMICRAADEGQKGYVTFTGVHGVIESQDDPQLRRILNESYLTGADGMPLVWLGRQRSGPQVGRVYGPDAMLVLCKDTAKSERTHFFYGGGEGVAEELAQKLKERYPELKIAGTYTPPFRPLNAEEEADLIAQVRVAKPDFFWVGISTPKQEKFMAEWLPKLDTKIMLGVGAAFDFHSGRKSQAPVWMQRSGLEWFYRMITEPRRLAGRYLRGNTRFLWLLARETFRRK